MPKRTPTPPLSSAQVTKSPDWSYWGNLYTVSLREALQLSLSVDPHTHVPALERDLALREQYWNRLLITKNHALDADWIAGKVALEDGDVSAEQTAVYLKNFAEWIVNDTTLTPFSDEFKRLAGSEVLGASRQSVNASKDWTQRPAKDFVEEKRRAGSYTAAGKLHGVRRQRYTEVYKRVVERQVPTKS
jgi:hypothetical protein